MGNRKVRSPWQVFAGLPPLKKVQQPPLCNWAHCQPAQLSYCFHGQRFSGRGKEETLMTDWQKRQAGCWIEGEKEAENKERLWCLPKKGKQKQWGGENQMSPGTPYRSLAFSKDKIIPLFNPFHFNSKTTPRWNFWSDSLALFLYF